MQSWPSLSQVSAIKEKEENIGSASQTSSSLQPAERKKKLVAGNLGGLFGHVVHENIQGPILASYSRPVELGKLPLPTSSHGRKQSGGSFLTL
jgi:hypothetical protein